MCDVIEKYIILNITESVLSLFNYNWNGPGSFHVWLWYSSDSDHAYIYETEFKRHFQVHFTTGTSLILSYYSQNFTHALCSFFEIEKDYNKIIQFIKIMIKTQLKNLDFNQLFIEVI